MAEPTGEQPRMYGRTASSTPLPWGWAESRLTHAQNYWVGTTRPDGRPHARAVWAVWYGDAVWFSTGSLAIRNLAQNPEVTVHTESGDECVIVEGTASPVAEVARLRPVVDAYNVKYDYDLDPDALPGPFFEVTPRVVFGWVVDPTGADRGVIFGATATRWRFGAQN